MTLGNGPLTDQLLDRLRVSAAMVSSLPGFAVQIRAGDEKLLEVRRTRQDCTPPGVVGPCAFHRAVVSALWMRRSGERACAASGDPAFDPSIDWGVTGGGKVFPGGIVRQPDVSSWRHSAVVLCEGDLVDGVMSGFPRLQAHPDHMLGVTLVTGPVALGDKADSRSMVEELTMLMGRVGAEDLERRLVGIPWVEADHHAPQPRDG